MTNNNTDEYQEPIELIGKVIIEPKVVCGDPLGCLIRVKWDGGFDGGYDYYDIIVMKGRKPWWAKKGNLIIAVGTLQGNKLMADDCRVFKPMRSMW